MSEITGYIEMPFHGEKGESAYEIAQKHGYMGTEAEWVESLGFIPDKSIGEEKLKDALVSKLKEYETFIGEVFDKKKEYAAFETNVYSSESEEYMVPYCKIGSSAFKIKIPKISSAVTLFDESDNNMWSTEMGDYRMSKIDVSAKVGETIRISGVANTLPYYPCAFCTDEEGNILERYADASNTVYGYTIKEGYTSEFSFADAIEATVPKGAKFLYVMGRRLTSGGVVTCDATGKAEIETVCGFVPNEEYKLMQSPLWGKKLYVDGDSICYGNGYKGGFGKIIADRYNMELVNAGVGGATISAMGATDAVPADTEPDWENNTYYLKLSGFNPMENKSADGFAYPLTKEQYETGFGVYPIAYRMVDGELTELEYTEQMPSGTFFVKFDVPTYDDNSVEKYYRLWASNSWLWEAYKSGFANVRAEGKCNIVKARHWLCKAVEEVDLTADYVVFEGGINDYLMNRPIGEITEDMTGEVDITTAAGGMEHLCRRLLKKCVGKKIVYVITHKPKKYAYEPTSDAAGSKNLTEFHDTLLKVLKKYSIPCVDLFEKSALNTEIAEYLIYTHNNDAVHPTKEGYEKFYVPQIVSCMESI